MNENTVVTEIPSVKSKPSKKKEKVLPTTKEVKSTEKKSAELVKAEKLAKKAGAIPEDVLNVLNAKFLEEHLKKNENRRNKKSIDLEYASFIADNPSYASKESEYGYTMYKWQGNYWMPQTGPQGAKQAFNWLEANAAVAASNRMAHSCHATAMLKSRPLPERGDDTIIPLLNCWIHATKDGTFNVIAPDQERGITYLVAASLKNATIGKQYTPAALPAITASLFAKFITTSLPDKQQRDLVQEFAGYTLVSKIIWHKGQFWVGNGANGKSVLIKLLETLHHKVASLQVEKLNQFGLAAIHEASLAYVSETPKSLPDAEIVKQMISGDRLSLERKGQDAFSYRPFAKVIFLANYLPRVNDQSDGFWRRFHVIEWKQQFGDDVAIPDLEERIIAEELDVFVDWCLEGLQRLLKRGKFYVPAHVTEAVNQERWMNDTVLQFKDTNFVVQSESFMSKNKVYEHYLEFIEENHLTPVGVTEFWKRMKGMFPQIAEKRESTGKRERVVNISFDDLAYLTPQEKADHDVELDKEIEEKFGTM